MIEFIGMLLRILALCLAGIWSYSFSFHNISFSFLGVKVMPAYEISVQLFSLQLWEYACKITFPSVGLFELNLFFFLFLKLEVVIITKHGNQGGRGREI